MSTAAISAMAHAPLREYRSQAPISPQPQPPLRGYDPSPIARIITPIAVGTAVSGAVALMLRTAPTALRVGLAAVGAVAGVAYTARWQSVKASEEHSYFIHFSTEPDFTGVHGDPVKTQDRVQRHYAAVSPPVNDALHDLAHHGLIGAFEPYPYANGFVARVRNDHVDEFAQRMQQTANVGLIEQGDA